MKRRIDEWEGERSEFVEIFEQSRLEGDKMVVVQLVMEYEMRMRRK